MMATSAIAIADPSDWCYGPYIGIDVQLRHIGFGKNLGNNLFKKNYAQGNPFIGFRFNDYLGIEVGYEETIKKSATTVNGPGSIELGDIVPESDFNFSTNTFRIRGPHASLVGYIPFCICDEKFDLIGSIGLISLRTKFTHQPTSGTVFGVPIVLTPEQMNNSRVDFKKRKTVLRATGGIQYHISCRAGFRAIVGWEQTNKFKNLEAKDKPFFNVKASLKNSVNYGLGIFWLF